MKDVGAVENSARSPEMALLAERIERFTPHDGHFELRTPGLHLYRISRARTSCTTACRSLVFAWWRRARSR